jgi:hypothetical protein
LKCAFSEAAVLFLPHARGGKRFLARIEKKHGKGRAPLPRRSAAPRPCSLPRLMGDPRALRPRVACRCTLPLSRACR